MRLAKLGKIRECVRGENHYRWKGGKIKWDKRGYIMVHSPNHPFKTKRGYVAEHRLVAEKKIGRPLREHEVVHHKDGNKKNFSRSNLRVTSRSYHSKLHSRYKY